ncbi:UDP-glucose dehydrogenase family protein [Chondrinema litorale]|uniref:UDP-glucose dehydrogenase family protein n=1 Tax=Chondrinema litorale TaxID=2994555 RepID=UPI002543CE1D|nr:nucleotide sugar dehydrogenase [Chondrinema litorale]UZR92622.1 nucleotide sugar dehydrogenase [Chondrinema litorale]
MITVIGLGFVGLTTGLGFAKKGFKTYGIDINEARVNKLKNFEIPFHEPHLKEVLEETSDKTFFLNPPLEEAVKNSKAIFICVGTPAAADGSADLKYILGAIDQILAVDSDDFKVIITKSTVPPSTVSKKVKPYVDEKLKEFNRNIGFASNPEFLREGYCWEDFIEPDRVVIGVEDEESKEILDKIYKPFNAPIHYVSYNSAEFIKYLSNTLLSTLISYSNEMSMVADHIGDIDVAKAFRILHEDKRWFGSPASMSSYVYPGCGYGGYCLPKDTSALYSISKDNGFTPEVLGGNLKINEQVKDFVVSKIADATSPSDTIGILGLSFKTGSDDVRLTPSKDVITKLIDKGYTNIIAYDPLANQAFQEEYPDIKIKYIDTLEELLEQTENVAILTGWKEFKEKKELINKKNVFDYRYIY